jgi:membrane protein implicated in regulation of membrane protease activity
MGFAALSILGDLLSRFPIANAAMLLATIGGQLSNIVFFVLYIVLGITTARGNAKGVIGTLIVSIVKVLMVIFFAAIISQFSFMYFLFLALYFLFISPDNALSLFNIYYSLKALRRRRYISGPLMTIHRFLACSLQHSLGIFVLVPLLPIYILLIILNPLMFIPTLILTISGVLLIKAGNHIFKNSENNISKKRVYFTNIAALFLIIVALMLPSVFFSFAGELAREAGFAISVGSLLFLLPVTLSFVIASSGLVAAIPQHKYLLSTSVNIHVEERRNNVLRQSGATITGSIYCRYCGKHIPEDSVFCPYCGRRLRWVGYG